MKIWESEQIPEEWKEGYLVKLPKKGDLSSCNNWQGIMLLSVPSKILTRIILERLKKALDKTLREEQAGFRQDTPHRHPANYHRAVAGMAVPSVLGIR